MFVEMGFHHPVVVHSQCFTKGVLCDLESSIRVAAERRRKKEVNRQRQIGVVEGTR